MAPSGGGASSQLAVLHNHIIELKEEVAGLRERQCHVDADLAAARREHRTHAAQALARMDGLVLEANDAVRDMKAAGVIQKHWGALRMARILAWRI